MAIEFYKSNQELFQGIVMYYDGTYSGKTYCDIISGYNGTCNGSASFTGSPRISNRPTYIPNVIGNKITLCNSTQMPAAPFTVIMWVKLPSSLDVTNSYLIDNFWNVNDAAGRKGYLISVSDATSLYASSIYLGSWNNSIYANSISSAGWYLLAFSCDVSGGLNTFTVIGPNYYSSNATPSTITVSSHLRETGLGYFVRDTSNPTTTISYGEVMIFNKIVSLPIIRAIYGVSNINYLYPIMSPRGVE